MGVPLNKVQHQQYLQQQQVSGGNVIPVSPAVLNAVDPSLLDYQDSINNYIASGAIKSKDSIQARPGIVIKPQTNVSTKGKSQPALGNYNSARNTDSLDDGSEAVRISSDDNNSGNMFPRVSVLHSNNVSTKNPSHDTSSRKVPSLNLLDVNPRNDEYLQPSVPTSKQLGVGSSKRNR